MRHSHTIERAIKKVAVLHKDQKRKGEGGLPYVTHLFSVALILSEYTDDEDVIVAGLLHDTLEDTVYTEGELERDFGKRVHDIVVGVTEPKYEDGEKLPWEERKRAYIRGLQQAPKESLLVSAADKTHNFQSATTNESYLGDPEAFKKDFQAEDRVRFYSAVVDVITEGLGEDHALVVRLRDTFARYKDFLEKMYT